MYLKSGNWTNIDCQFPRYLYTITIFYLFMNNTFKLFMNMIFKLFIKSNLFIYLTWYFLFIWRSISFLCIVFPIYLWKLIFINSIEALPPNTGWSKTFASPTCISCPVLKIKQDIRIISFSLLFAFLCRDGWIRKFAFMTTFWCGKSGRTRTQLIDRYM